MQIPRLGAPPDIKNKLFGWLYMAFRRDRDLLFRIVLWSQQDIPDPRLPGIQPDGVINLVKIWAETTETRVLDVVHRVLIEGSESMDVDNLRRILDSSNSMYAVRQDLRGLEERQPSAVIDQVKQTVADASIAVSRHLTSAWNGAYGYEKNTVHAYDEAIRAVETVMRQVMRPDDSIFQAITNAQWEFVLTDHRPERYKTTNNPAADGVAVVIDLMRLLAYSQHKRHGGEGANPTETEAKTAVMLAMTLVQLVNGRALQRQQ